MGKSAMVRAGVEKQAGEGCVRCLPGSEWDCWSDEGSQACGHWPGVDGRIARTPYRLLCEREKR